jgi:hypothetical protein
LYLKNCISEEDINFIVSTLNDPSMTLGDQRAVSFVNAGMSGPEKEIEIFKKIHPVMKKSMEVYANHFNKNIGEYQILAEDYFIKTFKLGLNIGPHCDSWESKNGELVPHVTAILYLSSDYDGGEFVFTDKKYSIKPKAGDIIIFESNIMHHVNPLISGTRVSTDILFLK